MRGQAEAEDDHEENTGSVARGPAACCSRGQRALLIRVLLGVAVVGLPAMAVIFRGRAPKDRSKLAMFAESAPPQVAALVGEAAGVADRLVQRFPDDPDSLNVLAWVHFRFGGSDEAVGYWRTCLELNPAFVDAYFSMGSAARDSGDHQKAAACFRKAWELDPAWPNLAEHLAQALINLGKMQEAIQVLEKNLQTHPKSTRSLTLVGDICAQRKEHEKAKQSYEAAMEISPDSASACYGAANACAALGDAQKSKEYMEKFKALKRRGEADYRQALNTHDDVLFVRWGVAETCMAAGKVYLAHGDPQTAEAHFRRGADLCPTHPECVQLLAWLYEQQGRTGEAIAAWLEAKQGDPHNVIAHLGLGTLYVRLGQFEAAEEVFQGVIRTFPEEGGGYAALADLYLQADRKLPQAKKLAQKAAELEPLARRYFLLCLICRRSGDLRGAVSAIERAGALDPGNADYRRMRELIQQDQLR